MKITGIGIGRERNTRHANLSTKTFLPSLLAKETLMTLNLPDGTTKAEFLGLGLN